MSNIILFAKIHSTEELGKGNHIIDIEVISLDKKGILPNIDFILKVGKVQKTRTTNNEGIYRNEEIFKSKIEIEEIEILNIKGKSISKYFLPSYISVVTQNEINHLNKNLNDLRIELNEKNDMIKNLKKDNDYILNFQNLSKIDISNSLVGNTKYETLQIGNKIWMIEDLRFQMNSDVFINDNVYLYKARYGKIINIISNKTLKKQGWRIPVIEDFELLVDFLKSDEDNILNLNNPYFFFDDLVNKGNKNIYLYYGYKRDYYNKLDSNSDLNNDIVPYCLYIKNKTFLNYENCDKQISNIRDKIGLSWSDIIYAKIRLVKALALR